MVHLLLVSVLLRCVKMSVLWRGFREGLGRCLEMVAKPCVTLFVDPPKQRVEMVPVCRCGERSR